MRDSLEPSARSDRDGRLDLISATLWIDALFFTALTVRPNAAAMRTALAPLAAIDLNRTRSSSVQLTFVIRRIVHFGDPQFNSAALRG